MANASIQDVVLLGAKNMSLCHLPREAMRVRLTSSLANHVMEREKCRFNALKISGTLRFVQLQNARDVLLADGCLLSVMEKHTANLQHVQQLDLKLKRQLWLYQMVAGLLAILQIPRPPINAKVVEDTL